MTRRPHTSLALLAWVLLVLPLHICHCDDVGHPDVHPATDAVDRCCGDHLVADPEAGQRGPHVCECCEHDQPVDHSAARVAIERDVRTWDVPACVASAPLGVRPSVRVATRAPPDPEAPMVGRLRDLRTVVMHL